MSGSSFRTFIDLSLAGNAAAGLAAVTRGLFGVHLAAGKANAALTGMNKTAGLALGGALAIAGGVMILKAVGATVQANNRYLEQINQLKAAGLSMKEVAEAEAVARQTSARVLGTTYTENLKAYRELRQAVPDQNDIGAWLPTVQAMAMNLMVTKNASGMPTTREQAQEQVFDVVKAFELSKFAKEGPEVFERIMNRWQESMTFYAGKLDMRDFHQVAKYSKAAFGGYSEEYLTDYMPTLITEMKTGRGGAASVGTMQSMLYRMTQGNASHKAVKAFESYGLINPQDVIYGRNGAVKGFNAGGLVGNDLLQQNPVRWLQEVVLPAMKAKGVDTTNEGAVAAAMSGIFGSNQNANNMARIAVQKEWGFTRDRDLSRKALNISEQQEQNLKGSPAYRAEVRSAAWENIKTSLGSGVAELLNKVMPTITLGINNFAKVLADHPNLAKYIIVIASALGIFALVVGVIMVVMAIVAVIAAIGAGPIIGIVAIVVAIGAAIGLLLTLDWKAVWASIKDIGSKLWKGLKDFVSGFVKGVMALMTAMRNYQLSIYRKIGTWFVGVWNGFIAGAGTLFMRLVNWFKELPKKLGDAITGDRSITDEQRRDFDWRPRNQNQDPTVQRQSYVPSRLPANVPVLVQTSVNLDGREIARSTDAVFHRATERRQAGPSDFNPYGSNIQGAQIV